MMAALWSDVAQDIGSARHHFTQALAIVPDCRFDHEDVGPYIYVSAFMHAMQSGYTSFETGLRRIYAMLDEPLPVGSDWPAVMLRRAGKPLPGSRPAILDDVMVDAADELRRFRHVAMHVYDRFDGHRALEAVKAAKIFVAEIGPAIDRFRAAIDPD